ncbi:PadR family transcriptional regulator [Candidatus Bathyarchaeota archaeon]|nr:PadR family transcriptional regulator [Candidatus Bathyarchaeota archaeon]
MSKISGKVPRGFTRFYVLHLLTERSMTGKEIIEEAQERSEGDWTPSPGLIYPLLGRLVRDGLIAETDEGGFTATERGVEALQQYTKLQGQLERQFELVNKLGLSVYSKGKFIAEEAVDRMSVVSSSMWDRVTKRSGAAQRSFEDKYEEFLVAEMEKLRQRKEDRARESVEAPDE